MAIDWGKIKQQSKDIEKDLSKFDKRTSSGGVRATARPSLPDYRPINPMDRKAEREDRYASATIGFDTLGAEKERAQKSAADTGRELRLSNARENLARRAGFPVNGINIDQERERQSDLSKELQGYRRDIERIDYIQGYQGVTREDNFGGQFRASYDVGQMGQDEAMAWKDYLSNPTPQNRLYAEAVSKVREDYMRRNQDALDDDATLPWITQDLAQYLPQLKGQTIAGAKGALGGAAVGTVIPVAGTAAGAKAGYVAGRAAYGFDTMQGFAFKSLLDAGLDEQTAREAAMDEAFISSLIEGGDAAIDLLTLGGGKVISALFKKSAQTGAKITKPIWKQILSGGAAVLGNALGEGIQEWTQEGVSIANQKRGGTGLLDLAGASVGQMWDAAFGGDTEALAQMNDAGAAGFRIGLMVGGGSRLTNAALERAINRQNGMAGSDVEDMASTFGPSGSRAFTNAVENGAPATGIYSDFVNAYNSGLHGREMPAATSDAISAGQMQAAYYAGQNDAGEKGGASRVSERTADDSAPERQADLLEQLRQQGGTITNRQAERLMDDQAAMETLRSSAGLNLSAQDTMSKRRSAVKQAFARYARENAAQPAQETVQAKQAVAGEQVFDYAKEAGDVLRNGIFTDVYGSAFERTGISYSDLDRALTKISRNEIDTSDPVVAAVMSVLDGTEEQVATASGVEAQATKLAQNTVGGEIDASLLNSFGENGRKAFANSARNSTSPEDIYPEFSRAYVEGLTGAGQRDGMSEIAQAAYYAGQNDAEASLISERAEAGSATIHSDARFVPNEYSAEMDTDTVNYLDTLAKATGTKIQMSAATGPKGKNGWYGDDGFIYIAVDADKPAIEVAKHEITHRLQKIAPEEYRQYRDYAMNALLEEGSIADLVELYKARYAEVYADMTDEKAMDEIAADFTERLIVDPARFARLSQDNRSVARKLLDAIKHFVSKVKSAFSDSARRNAAARDTFGVDLGTLEEAARLWEQALAAGAERVRNTQASSLQTEQADATIGNTRYSLKEDDNGQKAGTDRIRKKNWEVVPEYTTGTEPKSDIRQGSGSGSTETGERKIGYTNRTEAEQQRLTEILVSPFENDPEWMQFSRSIPIDEFSKNISEAIDNNNAIIQDMMKEVPGFAKAVADARAYANRGRTLRGRSIGAAVEHATNKDSFGRTLSKEQQAYFAGSVARDPYGNLLRLFHGSRTDVFTEFDLYEGVWLTEDRNYAKNYADLRSLQSQNISLEDQIYSDDRLKIFEMYADISNPVDLGEINDVLTAGKIRELAKILGVRYNELRDIAKPYMNENIYSLTRSREFIDLVGRQGFDGMMATEGGVETWCAIGSPDQVKLTSNETPTADPDIRYSLKGTSIDWELAREISRITNEGRENGRSEEDIQAEVRSVVQASYQKMLERYGAISKGERPAREVQVPKRTAEERWVSQTVRTILEAGATPEEAIPNIEELTARGVFSYEKYTDRQAIADAEADITDKSYKTARDRWIKKVEKGKVSKRLTAEGWAIYNAAANSGDIETAMTVLTHMVEHQRNAAQAVQAARILKQMGPMAQLYGVQRSAQNLAEELKERYGDKAPDLEVNRDLAEQFLRAKTQNERDEALKRLYMDIGRQMPSRFRDKWNAWRYLAMLGNPRTHVRNVLGNAFFAPVVLGKDLTATAIEAAVHRVSGGRMVRSKRLLGPRDRTLLAAAWADYEHAESQVLGDGKYSDDAAANRYVQEGRVIFKNKLLEKARRANSQALEREDIWFSRPHYAYALSQYAKANGITAEQIKSGNGLNEARAYAIREAQKATYRDTNVFSEAVSGWGRYRGENPVNKAASMVLEGILPFRKTPANILVRGVEYSPLGLLKSLTYDLAQVKRGKVDAATAIDNISAGLTGTALMALGVFLAAEGLIRGAGEGDDKEREFDELRGHQAYSLEIDGQSFTLDWLAPEALPFFVGVNLWEQTRAENEDITLSAMLQAVGNVTEPLLEMSCLQSLNDVFDAVGYASSAELGSLASILASASTSYLTQAIPSLLGQIERTGQDIRMTTYTERDAFLTPEMQYTIGRASSRIPVWDYQQIPYIDAWGRMEAEGPAWSRAVDNFLNPAYSSIIETSPMEEELARLYEQTGEAGVLPSRAARYFTVDGERKDLTAEEYVKFAQAKGQAAYDILTELTTGTAYQTASDTGKVEMVKLAYEYARDTAKSAVSSFQPDGWVAKAQKAEKSGVPVSLYIPLYVQQKGVESLKYADGEPIDNSRGLLVMEMVYDTKGLTGKQRQQLFTDFDVGKSVQHYNQALVQEKLEKMQQEGK